MKVNETGVLESSEVFFSTPSAAAQSIFFHLLCCGNFDCNSHYRVKRSQYNSILLILVVRGSGYVIKAGKRVALKEGSMALVDCFQPHEYGSTLGWKILWCHFQSSQILEWYKRADSQSGGVVQLLDFNAALQSMKQMIGQFKRQEEANEAVTHLHLTRLLTEFLRPQSQGSNSGQTFESLIAYINENLDKRIKVEELADMAGLSVYHFIRKFKKDIGYTPHEYLIHARINAAKFYLKTTRNPIKTIVFDCGFSSDSAFSNSFKRIVGTTPAVFRESGS